MNTSTTSSPTHIAIICDGNRRWAKEHGMQAMLGHATAAKKTFEPLIARAIELKIKYLTFWVFSTENWKRPQVEVEGLFSIFRAQFKAFLPKCHQNKIRIQVIGDTSKFPEDLQKSIDSIVKATADYDSITLVFAMNYGGRDELVRTVNNIILRRINSTDASSEVTSAEIEVHLDTHGIPDPDMIVRTSGEYRLSGFLPWQSVYSELFFIPEKFPEFTPEKLTELVEEYHQRKRRFGK